MSMIKSKEKNNVFSKPRLILGRTPYQLFEIIYLIYVLFTIIFTELFEGEKYDVLPFDIIGDYVGFLLTCLMLGLLLLFIAKHYFYVKPNYFFISILSVMFIGNSIALITFPQELKAITVFNEEFTYSLDNLKKYEYLFMFLNSCLFLYVTYVCVPVCRINKSILKNLAILFLIVTYFAVVFSYFSDSETYYAFFNSKSEKNDSQITSFIGDKNVFGMIIFLAMIIHFKFLFETRNYMHLFAIIYLFAHEIIIECRSAAVAGLILFLGYFIIVGIEQLNNHKKLSVVIFTLLGLGFILINLIVFVPAVKKVSLFKKIADVLTGSFTTKEGSTFYSRLNIWNRFFTLVNNNPIFFIFGLGTMNFNYAFLYARDTLKPQYWHMHNGFLEPWGEGGIIRFAINIIFIVYILYLVISLFKKTKDKRMLLYLTFLLAFFARTIFEPEFLLSTSWASIVSIITIALPIFTYKEQIKNKQKLRKASLITNRRIDKERLLYLLPVSLISNGILVDNLYIRIGLITLGFILQLIGYFLLMKKISYLKQDERKFREFSFIMILDTIISIESVICYYLFNIDFAQYLYNLFFAYSFAIFFYYFANEYLLLDDEFSFIKKAELKYENKTCLEMLKNDNAIRNDTIKRDDIYEQC